MSGHTVTTDVSSTANTVCSDHTGLTTAADGVVNMPRSHLCEDGVAKTATCRISTCTDKDNDVPDGTPRDSDGVYAVERPPEQQMTLCSP